MKKNEIKAKSIITKSSLPDADYVINPYTGCTHSCIYCYARFMRRFSGHQEDWGKFVDIKSNAAELIPIRSERYHRKKIFISSVTDPYQPVEKKYQLTRKILKKLVPLQPALTIQSKSALIARDIDILKKFNNCMAGISLNTLDDSLRKEIEPFTSCVETRLQALQKINSAGIKTYLFMSPIMPYLTDWEKIIKKAKDYTDIFFFENINMHGSITSDIFNWIKQFHPQLIYKYQWLVKNYNSYWDEVEKKITAFCKNLKVDYKIFFHHSAK